MSLVTDPLLAGRLKIEDAEALIARLREKVEAVAAEDAKCDAEFVPGGLYLDQHGTAYLAVDDIGYDPGAVRLWRLTDRATEARPEWWATEGIDFRPVTAACGCVLMANGIEVHS